MQLQALPALEDNYIWAASAPDGGVLVVDPGDAAPVFEAAGRGLRPAAVLLTHHHHDHIGGTAALLQRWPDLPVIAPHDARITLTTRRVGDGERITLAGASFDVIAVPGHTLSHIAFHSPTAQVLFCGDTLFSLGCGRLFEGTPAQMWASLSRLAALPATTRVCCGHEYTLANAAFASVVEPDNLELQRRTLAVRAQRDAGLPSLPSTLADELACNPFLRCEHPAVQAVIAQRLSHPPRDAVDTFAELRRWKDGFHA